MDNKLADNGLTEDENKIIGYNIWLLEKLFELNPQLKNKLTIQIYMPEELAYIFVNASPNLWIAFKPLNDERTYWEFNVINYSQ